MNIELRNKIILEIIIGAILLITYIALFLSIDILVEQSVFSTFDSRFFPKTISSCLIVLSAVLFINSCKMWKNYKEGNITLYMKSLLSDSKEPYPLKAILLYIAILFLYLLGFHYLGFVYSTPLVMLITSYLLGMRNLLAGAIFAVVFTLALDYASLHLLQILLPSGVLFS